MNIYFQFYQVCSEGCSCWAGHVSSSLGAFVSPSINRHSDSDLSIGLLGRVDELNLLAFGTCFYGSKHL